MGWRLKLLERMKLAGISLIEGKSYSAQKIRSIAQILNPTMIWRKGLESRMNAAKSFENQIPIESKIPENNDNSFELNLVFEMFDTYHISFKYDKNTKDYTYFTNYMSGK